jgi:hypothetical protein
MIINLTQHTATPEQIEAGVVELPAEIKSELIKLLTFDKLPTNKELHNRADSVDQIVCDYLTRHLKGEESVSRQWRFLRSQNIKLMIGGAPYFMRCLEDVLSHWATVVYAFSERESVEVEKDGVVTKTSIFKHKGFIEVK